VEDVPGPNSRELLERQREIDSSAVADPADIPVVVERGRPSVTRLSVAWFGVFEQDAEIEVGGTEPPMNPGSLLLSGVVGVVGLVAEEELPVARREDSPRRSGE